MSYLHSADLLRANPAPGRECGPCTACCSVLQVYELGKPMYHSCDHVTRSGCGVYETRPQTCREFHCVWLRGGIGDDERTRPDQLGVLFDYFIELHSGTPRFQALPVWSSAMDQPTVRPILDEISSQFELMIIERDGYLVYAPGGPTSLPVLPPNDS